MLWWANIMDHCYSVLWQIHMMNDVMGTVETFECSSTMVHKKALLFVTGAGEKSMQALLNVHIFQTWERHYIYMHTHANKIKAGTLHLAFWIDLCSAKIQHRPQRSTHVNRFDTSGVLLYTRREGKGEKVRKKVETNRKQSCQKAWKASCSQDHQQDI